MIVGILQARFNSTRLPGKVLKPILGQAMLMRQIERLQRSRRLNKLIIATSDEVCDDPIAALCVDNGVSCFRGSLDDVLDRFYQASLAYHPQHVVRLTGDCPLIEPMIVDQLIEQHLIEQNDYTANCLTPSFPDGLDVEVMRFTALQQAWKLAQLPSEREHVTPYIYKHTNQFKINQLLSTEDFSHLRWTVDEPEDFRLIETIYQVLYPQNPVFTWQDILYWLTQNPQWKTYNKHFERNAGMKKSLSADQKFMQQCVTK